MSDPVLARALEADLKSEYGVDIGVYYRRSVPLRRFLLWMAELPPDSRTARAFAERPYGITTTDELLLNLIQMQQAWLYMWQCSKTDPKKQKPPEPKPIEAPEPLELSQSTKDEIERARAESESAKWDDYEFADITDVARLLGGG